MKKSKVNPVLFEKIIRKSEQYAKVSIKNREIANQWLEIANNDISISKKLLELKYYAGAVYHLQQGYEKITKGYYIHTGRMTPEQATSHKFILDRLKKEVKDEYLKDLADMSASINDKIIDLTSSQNVLQNLENTEEKWRNISSEEINFILNFLEKLEVKLKSEETLQNLEKRTSQTKFLKMIKFVIYKITNFRVRDSQVRDAVEQYKLLEYVDGILLGIKLHYLSLITFLHYNTPRYPNIKDSEVNYFTYDEKMGIVNNTSNLIKSFEDIFSKINKMYTEDAMNKQQLKTKESKK